MHCIFCCSGYGGNDLPERALSWLTGSGFIDLYSNSGKNADQEYLKYEAPYYIYQLMEGEPDSKYLDLHDNRLKRITIFEQVEVQ